MNQELFSELFKHRPSQLELEWRMFLEICEAYILKHKIENPIVVELGIWKNKQKQFYEQLLGAEHIGIDASIKRSVPDIHGNTHDLKIIETLKNKLKGRSINILFIDASHRYEDVKKDFELYSPLCSDIIVLHDINTHRYNRSENSEVWKFWDELKLMIWKCIKEYMDFTYLSIQGGGVNNGIGMIIKR